MNINRPILTKHMVDTYLPLVSVIIPNYNYARYLEQRIESIIKQTYPNFEIILLDDMSTDNSLEIINKYRNNEKVAKIIVNKENSGSPFKQWEKGLDKANGDIIWIAESDDYCELDFLEVLVKKHIANNSVITFCKSKLVDEDGCKLRENHQMSGVNDDVVLPGRDFISTYLAFSNVVQNASCAIFSKTAALTIDKSFMNYKGAGDWLFWIEIAEKGNVFFVNQELNYYRLHSNTTSKVVKNGIEFHEMKSIYEKLFKIGYLDSGKYQKCRLNNIMLIYGIEEMPPKVKRELYTMWNVDLFDRVILLWMMVKNYSVGGFQKLINAFR